MEGVGEGRGAAVELLRSGVEVLEGRLERVEREKHNPQRDLLRSGELALGKWRVVEKIGNGGFGQIYSARGGNWEESRLVGLKVERCSVERESLTLESRVLRSMAGKEHFPRLEGLGPMETEGGERIGVLAMELLSANLSELRRLLRGGRISGQATRRLGVQCVDALRQLHNQGWLHRDVKPSNWALGLQPATLRVVKLIDFGLARRYIDSRGEHKPPRDKPGFRGTVRYASLRAHDNEDLGRADDLISLSYMLMELASGALPWRRQRDKDPIAESKRSHSPQQLTDLIPVSEGDTQTRRSLTRFHLHLSSLQFSSTPDYTRLKAILLHRLPQPLPPFDWERSHLLR